MIEPPRASSPDAVGTPGSPQLRFLARCAFLSVAMVSLWYFVLLNPMLGALRLSADLMLRLVPGSAPGAHIAVDSQGDWEAPIPLAGGQVPAWLSQYVPAGKAGARIAAINVTFSKATASFFTLGLPLYWATLLAGPRGARFWRALALGTALLAAAAPLSCAVTVRNLAAPYLSKPGGWEDFAFGVAAYLAANVAPYIAPPLIALTLNPKLRAMLIPWEAEEVPESPVRDAAAKRKGDRARKYRQKGS